MAIGTAGYTAMLAVMALERHGVTPERGPVVVTGAAGGVGSVAIALLAKARLRGHRLDRPPAGGRLPQGPRRRRDHRPRRTLRAAASRSAKERWAGRRSTRSARTTLANAAGDDAATAARSRPAASPAAWTCRPSVAPFILRGVSLLGIDCVMCPQAVRREAWNRLATDLDRGKLQTMTNEIQLPGVLVAAPAILDGRIRGRIVVKIP